MASEAEAILSETPHPLHSLTKRGWQLPCPLAAISLAFLEFLACLLRVTWADTDMTGWQLREMLCKASPLVPSPSCTFLSPGSLSQCWAGRCFLQRLFNQAQRAVVEGWEAPLTSVECGAAIFWPPCTQDADASLDLAWDGLLKNTQKCFILVVKYPSGMWWDY